MALIHLFCKIKLIQYNFKTSSREINTFQTIMLMILMFGWDIDSHKGFAFYDFLYASLDKRW